MSKSSKKSLKLESSEIHRKESRLHTSTSENSSSSSGLTRKNDRTTFLSGFFQPKAIRDDYYTIYWFNKELSRIGYSTKEKALGLGKLDFWIESVEGVYKVSRIQNKGQVNREPISIALAETISKTNIPKSLFLRLIQSYVDIVNPENRF